MKPPTVSLAARAHAAFLAAKDVAAEHGLRLESSHPHGWPAGCAPEAVDGYRVAAFAVVGRPGLSAVVTPGPDGWGPRRARAAGGFHVLPFTLGPAAGRVTLLAAPPAEGGAA